MSPRRFRELVWKHYAASGRHDLPWRKTHDAYRILVSEVMLQQTQVERVIPYYRNFLKRFPTASVLAKASLADVLREWQGLGYNRRAKMLHAAAEAVVEAYKGKMPTDAETLRTLPGIGPYTAGAVASFSANADAIIVETNIRTAVTHHFFPERESVPDADIISTLEKAHPAGQSREWYAALMDYGSHLKRSGVRINARAKGYTKQKPFKGSMREARGAVLKALSRGTMPKQKLLVILGDDRKDQVAVALIALTAEGLIEGTGSSVALAS